MQRVQPYVWLLAMRFPFHSPIRSSSIFLNSLVQMCPGYRNLLSLKSSTSLGLVRLATDSSGRSDIFPYEGSYISLIPTLLVMEILIAVFGSRSLMLARTKQTS